MRTKIIRKDEKKEKRKMQNFSSPFVSERREEREDEESERKRMDGELKQKQKRKGEKMEKRKA